MKRVLLAGLFVLVAAPAALAAPEDVANKIAGEIMSPFCPGVTLHDCPSQEADEMRAQIRDWSAAGWSEERIMSELVAEYGPGVRAVPATEEGGLAAWLLPAAAVVIGLGVAALLAIKWAATRRGDAGPLLPAPQPTPEQRERLSEELTAHEAQVTGISRPKGAPWTSS